MNRLIVLALLSSAWATAQAVTLEPSVTLPISFTKSVRAANAKAGDEVEAVTVQRVALPSGVLPSGTRVIGHVIAANAFAYDKTPYASQKAGSLRVQFDAVVVNGEKIPLNVIVRAIASPIAREDAASAASSDLDSLGTQTQIGGDQLVPSQTEVRNREGDVVAYNKRDGVYAHLIARGDCDGGSREVSVAMFSASACGAYGFGTTTAVERGSATKPSVLTLVSTHGSPEIWKHTTALLEVVPAESSR